MGLHNSGRISLKEIGDEFGETPPYLLSEMYGKGGVTSSGKIQIGNFYGKASSIGVAASEGEGYRADDGYTYWLITQSRNFEVASGGPVEVCLVGGGGGGGEQQTNSNEPLGAAMVYLGAGGGRVTRSSINLSAGSHPIVIGQGGDYLTWYGSNGGTTTAFGLSAGGGGGQGGQGTMSNDGAAGGLATNDQHVAIASNGYIYGDRSFGPIGDWPGIEWPIGSGCWFGQKGGAQSYSDGTYRKLSDDGRWNFGNGGDGIMYGKGLADFRGIPGCVIVRSPTPSGRAPHGPVSHLLKRQTFSDTIVKWGNDLDDVQITGGIKGIDSLGVTWAIFENSGSITFNKLSNPSDYSSQMYTFLDVLVVGAGGSGNSKNAGGGGGVFRKRWAQKGSSMPMYITVGAAAGGKGGDSNIRWGMFSGYTAEGGGFANYPNTNWQTDANGGSGAGGGGISSYNTPLVDQTPTDGYFGNHGGPYYVDGAPGWDIGGGGGGAYAAGGTQHGGAGIQYPSVGYAGTITSDCKWGVGGSHHRSQYRYALGRMNIGGERSAGAGGNWLWGHGGNDGIVIIRYKAYINDPNQVPA